MSNNQQPKVGSKPEYGLLAEDFEEETLQPTPYPPKNSVLQQAGGSQRTTLQQVQQQPTINNMSNVIGNQQQSPGMGVPSTAPQQQLMSGYTPALQGQSPAPFGGQQPQPYTGMQVPGPGAPQPAYQSNPSQQYAPSSGNMPQQAAPATQSLMAPSAQQQQQQQMPYGSSMPQQAPAMGTLAGQQPGYAAGFQQAPYSSGAQQQPYTTPAAYTTGAQQQQQLLQQQPPAVQGAVQPTLAAGAPLGMQQPMAGFSLPPPQGPGPSGFIPQHQPGGVPVLPQAAGGTYVQPQQQQPGGGVASQPAAGYSNVQQQQPGAAIVPPSAAGYTYAPQQQPGSMAAPAGGAYLPGPGMQPVTNASTGQTPANQVWAGAGAAQPPQAGSAVYTGGQWAPAGSQPVQPGPAAPLPASAGNPAAPGSLPQLSRGVADLSLSGAPAPGPPPSLNRAGNAPAMQQGFGLNAEITPAPVQAAAAASAQQQVPLQLPANNMQPGIPPMGQAQAGPGGWPNRGLNGAAAPPVVMAGQQPGSAPGGWPQVPQMPSQTGVLPAGPGAPPLDNRRPAAPPPPPMYSLELLAQQAAGQREVLLTDVQANDIIQQLNVQAAQSGTEPPHMVDLADAHKRWMDSLGVKALAYIHTLETAAPGQRLPLNSRPSLLQTKLKHGRNRLQDLVVPTLEPSQQQLVDLSFGPDGALQEQQARVWQFALQLVKAEGVGPTGLKKVRQPCLHIARLALFDRANHCFLGNVCGVRPDAVTNKDKTWEFNSKEPLIVRCNCIQKDSRAGTRLVNDDALCIYIEFNTSHRLDIADTKLMPPHEHKAARMVDEVTTCWAMLNFRRCVLAPEMQEVSVPLYYGSLYDIQSLDAMYKEKRRRNPIASLLKAKHIPTLLFRAGPVPCEPPPALPYGFMPTTMIAKPELGTALAAYRVVMALQLCRQTSLFSPLADPVLASFPGILSDSHILTELLLKWKDGLARLAVGSKAGCCGTELLPPIAMVVELFRRCVSELSPLLQCATLPPRHINNFVEYQGHRLKLVQQYCHQVDQQSNMVTGPRHPVEPLSHAGFEFLHKPFNVTETRVCLKDRLEGGSTFIKAM